MRQDGFKDPGRFYGILLGWFIERRYIRFHVDGTLHRKVIRALVGGLLAVFWWTGVAAPLGKCIGTGVGHFLTQATTPFVFMTVYPWICSRIEKSSKYCA